MRFTILIIISFFSCQPSRPGEKKESEVSDSVTVLRMEDSSIEVPSALQKDREASANCVRGEAKSVLKKEVYRGAVFIRNDDRRTGTETLEFANGDRLVIYHWGCEYYVLTFRFETKRFRAEVTDLSYWIEKVIVLLFELQKGLDTPLDVKGGINELRHLAEGNKTYNLGEEMIYNDNEVRDFITIDRIEQLEEGRYAVEVSLATGPLEPPVD